MARKPIVKLINAKDILNRPFNGEYGLSPRETEALGHALKGKSRSMIAKEMNLTGGAVGQYLQRGLNKIGTTKSELGWWVLERIREELE
jgi:DNA-binding CsgD family transcriptional regulator